MRIFSAGPNLSNLDVFFVKDAAKRSWYENMNLYHNKCVNIIKKKFKSKRVILFSSCTGAMHVLFKALGFNSSHEVIVPDTTWIGTVSGLYHLGVKIKFADVNIYDWNINLESIKKNITKKTKAIVSVDLYGNPSDKIGIRKICKDFNLDFIEDAAPGIGSKFNGKFCGTFGRAGVFSFQGAKPLTCGEGGAVITNDNLLADKIEYYADHCRDKNKVLFNSQVGFKFKLSNLQAGMLYSQFKRFNQIIRKRRYIFNYYKKNLIKKNLFHMNNCSKKIFNNFYVPSISFKNNFNAKKLGDYLKLKNIDSRPFFRPLSELPMFKKTNKLNNKNSKTLFRTGINLPCSSAITDRELKYVCMHINHFLKKKFPNS